MSDHPQYPRYPGQPDADGPEQPPYGQAPPAYGQVPPPYDQAPPPYGQAPPSWGSAYPAPAQHGQPVWQPGYGYPQQPKNNTLAVISMVIGIVSIVFCYLGLVIGPVAVALGVMAKKDIASHPGTQTGGGMATAGIVTGAVGFVIWAGFIALIVLAI